LEAELIAYKFLCAGRVAPFTRHVWPEPGEWVEALTPAPASGTAGDGPAVCLTGVHACHPRDLPLWLDDELWEIELAGQIAESDSKVAAERGRLRRRIGAWNPGTMSDFALACALRARDHALWALRREGMPEERGAADSLAEAFTARAILAVAEAAETAVGDRARVAIGFAADAAESALDDNCPEGAYIATHAAGVIRGGDAEQVERAWQAEWLAERLELPATD
jgi:hypothetical protein